MKNKKSVTIILLVLCLALLAGGVFLVIFLNAENKAEEAEASAKVTSTETFAAWTTIEEFSTVPAMTGNQIKIGEAEDYGDGHYLIDVNGTSVNDYLNYLDVLENAGFEKHSDNGEDAMEGYAMTASFIKDNLTVTVSQAIKLEKTYISAVYDMQLSDHLIYDESYLDGVTVGAVNKFHMLQTHINGNSFIIQLKNGHFVMHDGGYGLDAPYFLDYLESLVPEGEKPVIEAWFISHAHGDHHGALLEILNNEKWINRIYVNGIYYMEPSQEYVASTSYSEETDMWQLVRSYVLLKSEDGGRPGYYRPQFGQRYYFCDIMIDVCLTPEQFSIDAYYAADFNETSIWLMHHIDGQRMLIAGDTYRTGMRLATQMFEAEYFDMDIMQVFHHGINVVDYFTDFITVKTLLYPNWRNGSLWQENTTIHEHLVADVENENLLSKAVEAYNMWDGTIVLTFPYQVGTAEQMESWDWKYDGGKRYTGNVFVPLDER